MAIAAVRIVNVRMKAGDNVVPFGRAQVRNDRKDYLVNHAARSFDAYMERWGVAPDAMVLVLGGLKQNANVFWTMQGDSEGGAVTMLSFAQAAITREIVDPS